MYDERVMSKLFLTHTAIRRHKTRTLSNKTDRLTQDEHDHQDIRKLHAGSIIRYLGRESAYPRCYAQRVLTLWDRRNIWTRLYFCAGIQSPATACGALSPPEEIDEPVANMTLQLKSHAAIPKTLFLSMRWRKQYDGTSLSKQIIQAVPTCALLVLWKSKMTQR